MTLGPFGEVPDYDPRRIMPSGETVYRARERLVHWSRELNLQAMSQVKRVQRDYGLTLQGAEDEVYCRRFGPDRFPLSGKAKEGPSLEERLKAEGS